MLTYQDYEGSGFALSFVDRLVMEHISSSEMIVATQADLYDRNTNPGIHSFYAMYSKVASEDTARPIDLAIGNNFFARLNSQRTNYSLGNGVTFTQDSTKEKLGQKFDHVLQDAGYYSLIHGCSFIFWNLDHCHMFKLTEFVPVWDEETGALRAGIRFWRLSSDKPMFAILYEEDGYTRLRSESKQGIKFSVMEEKRAYKVKYSYAPADSEPEVIGSENYTSLPIIPLWGDRRHQSSLVGMKSKLDNYDLVLSGFAKTLQDCAEIYWLIENYGGMTDEDLRRWRDRLTQEHIAEADTTEGGKINAYTQEVPTEARETLLNRLRTQIFEDYGAVDVKALNANATATEINASYQPMDEQADAFEFQVAECVENLLSLQGIEDTPQFKRNRISNQAEIVDMILKESAYLDDETVLSLLPNVTPDMIKTIMEKKSEEKEKSEEYINAFGINPKEQSEDGDDE